MRYNIYVTTTTSYALTEHNENYLVDALLLAAKYIGQAETTSVTVHDRARNVNVFEWAIWDEPIQSDE